MGRHLAPAPEDHPGAVQGVVDAAIRVGWVGVDVFFVLSGFLVAGLLLRQTSTGTEPAVGRFLTRRAFKIYPAFYAFMAVSIVVWSVLNGGLNATGDSIWSWALVRELTFFQNYGSRLWVHTWSLAVEEHFYLLLAALIAYVFRRPGSAADPTRHEIIPKVLAVVLVVVGLVRAVVALVAGASDALFFTTHSRIDSLAVGVLLAWFYAYRPDALTSIRDRFAPWLWVLVFCAAMVPVINGDDSRFTAGPGLTLVYLGAAALLILVFAGGQRPWQRYPRLLRAVAFLGPFSYSIYLWHMPARLWSDSLLSPIGLGESWSARTLVYIVGSPILGIAAARLIEGPVLALRDRLFPSSSAPSTPSTVAAAPVSH